MNLTSNPNKTEFVRCFECGKEYEKNKSTNISIRTGLRVGVRGKNTITCSKKCSKKYNARTKSMKKVNNFRIFGGNSK